MDLDHELLCVAGAYSVFVGNCRRLDSAELFGLFVAWFPSGRWCQSRTLLEEDGSAREDASIEHIFFFAHLSRRVQIVSFEMAQMVVVVMMKVLQFAHRFSVWTLIIISLTVVAVS